MKKVINIILLVVLGVSLSGCEWFEHNGGMKPFNNSESYDEAATNLITYGGSGKLYSNDTLAASILYPGTKKIELRTALCFLDTTSISGTWYLSKNDYLS